MINKSNQIEPYVLFQSSNNEIEFVIQYFRILPSYCFKSLSDTLGRIAFSDLIKSSAEIPRTYLKKRVN
jgi:hypothetical protein